MDRNPNLRLIEPSSLLPYPPSDFPQDPPVMAPSTSRYRGEPPRKRQRREQTDVTKPWSHFLTSTTESLPGKYKFGPTLAEKMASNVFLQNYRPSVVEQKEVQRRRRRRIGSKLEEEFVNQGKQLPWSTATIVEEPSSKEMANYNLNPKMVNLFLRRELLVYLSKIRTGIFQFVELLTAAMGMDYVPEDFIFVFPHDTLELSTKDPDLRKKQRYGVEDFMKELLHTYALKIGDKSIRPLVKMISLFLAKAKDDINLFPRLAAMHKKKIETQSRPQRHQKKPRQTTTVVHLGDTTADDKVATTKENSAAKTSKEAEVDDSDSDSTGEYDPSDSEDEEEAAIWETFADAWEGAFESLFRQDLAADMFQKNSSETSHGMGFLMVKPIVRGMIRIARAEINTEAEKDFGIDELMYSPLVSAHFAKYIALQQQKTANRGKHSMSAPSPNFTGNLYIINKTESRYNIAEWNANKVAAIEYWKRVFRNPVTKCLEFDKQASTKRREPRRGAPSSMNTGSLLDLSTADWSQSQTY